MRFCIVCRRILGEVEPVAMFKDGFCCIKCLTEKITEARKVVRGFIDYLKHETLTESEIGQQDAKSLGAGTGSTEIPECAVGDQKVDASQERAKGISGNAA